MSDLMCTNNIVVSQHLQNTEIYNANFNVHKKNIENTENCNVRFNVHKNIVVLKPYTFSATTKCTLHKKCKKIQEQIQTKTYIVHLNGLNLHLTFQRN